MAPLQELREASIPAIFEGALIREDGQPTAGPCEGNVEEAAVVQETNFPKGIGANEGHDHNVGLIALPRRD